MFCNTEELVDMRKDFDKKTSNFIYLKSKAKENEELENSDKTTQTQSSLKNKKDQRPLIIYTLNASIAYLLRKMPHTFGVACRILTEIKYRMPWFSPEKFLDFGAGLGSGSYAFHDIFQNYQVILACEPAKIMRKIGKHLTKDLAKVNWIENLAQSVNYSYGFDFDIVYCGYVFEEINSAENRIFVLQSLWQKVKPGGLLIFVEPGTPKGYRFIHDIRNWILENKKDDCKIIAPCPHEFECPLAKEMEWCHFSQRIGIYPKSVFPKLAKEKTFFVEKFSYLVVFKGKFPEINKNESLSPAEQSFSWPRILRPILKPKKQKIVDVCDLDGSFKRMTIGKSKGEMYGYKACKRLKEGDLWKFPKYVRMEESRVKKRKGKKQNNQEIN